MFGVKLGGFDDRFVIGFQNFCRPLRQDPVLRRKKHSLFPVVQEFDLLQMHVGFGGFFRLEKLPLPFPGDMGSDDEFQALMGVWTNPKRFFTHLAKVATVATFFKQLALFGDFRREHV
jgi:hypothetical protein